MLPPGPVQLALIFVGVLLAGGHSGAIGAVIMDVVHPGLRATAFAVITLGNNILGFAPGPLFVGVVSDTYGLQTAMAFAPLACLGAAFCFLRGARYYHNDCDRFEEPADVDAPAPVAA
jgi:MFS family permease